MAIIPQPGTNASGLITPAEAKKKLATGMWSDEATLKLVTQDADRAENFEATKMWVLGWPTATLLYQSPFTARFWEGTQVPASNIPFFTVAKMVNSLGPNIMNGLFYQNPPFMVQPRPKTPSEAARAVSAVLGYQLDDPSEDVSFRREVGLGVTNALLFGTSIWKYGWESYEKKSYRLKRKTSPVVINSAVPGAPPISIHPEEEDIEEEEITEQIDRPVFEHIVNLRQVLVDPGLNVPDIRKAKYVVHRMYMTWEEIDRLRDRPGFNIPTKEELLSYFLPPEEAPVAAQGEISPRNPLWDARAEDRFVPTTADPFAKPLEVLERWDRNKMQVVLQRKLVICNDENPYGSIPFLSVGWWDVPEAFWSLGLAKTVGSEQRLQQGITNAWLDGVSLKLNGVFSRVKGKSIPTQSIRLSPGKFIEVDNKDDITPLKMPDVVNEYPIAMSSSQARAEQISGANELTVQGSIPSAGRTSLGRTATGAGILASGSGIIIQDFVEKLVGQVIIPFLYKMHEMNRRLLPVSTLRHILTDELEHAYEGDPVDVLNAGIRFIITAGARMQARRNMAQALPIMTQFLLSPQTTQSLGVEKKKISVEEVLRMWFMVSDWTNEDSIILDMTPEDEKRWAMTTKGGAQQAQLQGKAQLQQQQFQNKESLEADSNIARAGREVLRQAMEQSATPEAITGEPGGKAFGTNA